MSRYTMLEKETITPNLVNLAILRDHLLTTEQEFFDMRNFVGERVPGGRNLMLPSDMLGHCGTTCCALGEGVKLEELKFMPDDYEKDYSGEALAIGIDETKINWGDYSLRVYGLYHFGPMWAFFFGDFWHHHDNSPVGAADRITFFLDGADIDDMMKYREDIIMKTKA